ncbi:C-terminal processing peptidase-3. Serine peptidase. MEROPS family S41A [Clostridium cavendishii DSM 21758]|uniref:C-terminal processing peptidase-3. Serine peptidase. MEROPS family S41A n=1 Tax=Clostridium cavendishii DSM 21758 TaxID=1121302 RepID=A0A1M6TVE3_9CLOT|nr:S41 family peptidase [Clostridium cavendishii]SHK60768.1 C-terminal processing peptidase-3. Serine peptidase. MEROPS family S41A [Clostridium cavendishii DSM 21758]
MDIGNEDDKQIKTNKKSSKIIITIVITALIISNIGAFYAGNKLAFKGVSLGATNDGIKNLKNIEDVSKYEKLFKIRALIYKLYDGNIKEDDLVEGAIKGMTESLKDPYTVFMNKDEYEDFSEKSEGNYMGVGMQVGEKDGKMEAATVFEGSPAEKAGIRQGDFIVKINDIPITGKDIDKAVSMMKGKEKAEIKLTILRENKLSEVKVTRDIVKMINVKGEMLDKSVGYIRISSFDEDVAKDFNKNLKQLKDRGMKGLILDLRGNPGGYMNECVNVVSNFIPKDKVIVSTINKYGDKDESKSVGGMAIGMPLVVLTDGGSASASEIVSGAIRDYKIGTLIGKKTYGKGVVQTVIDKTRLNLFDDGTALKVTISKYYTPNGENIHKKGIAPDIEVDYPKELAEKPYDRNVDPQFSKALEVIQEKIK